MSILAMQQVQIIGTFLDAKHQLESQRDFQTLKTQALKDYHPSEEMCRIGSYIRSVAANEEKAQYDHLALNDIFMASVTNRRDGPSWDGDASYAVKDIKISSGARMQQFKTVYCDPNDYNGVLASLCAPEDASDTTVGAADSKRRNNDINYQQTVEYMSSLDINLTDGELTEAEEDVIAMARHLYWPKAFRSMSPKDAVSNAEEYQRARQVMSMANLAHNSFAKQISMKTKAPEPELNSSGKIKAGEVIPGWAYMKTMLRDEFGISEDDVDRMVGKNPSYNAQMEVLTKKMLQNPDFFTNLYDKPTNVDRMQAALTAISIMQQRDMHETMIRREMLLSGIVENELITDAEIINGSIIGVRRIYNPF